jgi:hypothetical protein
MDATALQQILDKVLADQAEKHKAEMEALIVRLQGSSSKASEKEQLTASLAQRITTFDYLPEEGVTFQHWYNRYEKYFTVEGDSLSDDAKVRLLLCKMSTGEYNLYSNKIAPTKPDTLTFANTIDGLKSLFPDKVSLTTKRYELLRLRQGSEDFLSFAATINKAAENAKAALSMAEAKCFYFTMGLSDNFVDLKTKCLKYIDEKERSAAAPSHDELAELCSQAVALRDTALQLSNQAKVHANAVVHSRPQRDNREQQRSNRFENKVSSGKNLKTNPPFNKGEEKSKTWSKDHKTGLSDTDSNCSQLTMKKASKFPPRKCRFCKRRHLVRDCPHAPTCTGCQKKGHALHECFENPNRVHTCNIQLQTFATTVTRKSNTRKSDLWEVTVCLNNKPVSFILDTGSNATIISPSEWKALGMPTLQQTREKGRAYPQATFFLNGKFTTTVSSPAQLPIPVTPQQPRVVNKPQKLECYVAEAAGSNNLMGLPWIEALGLLTKTWSTNHKCRNDGHSRNAVYRLQNQGRVYPNNMSQTFNRKHGAKPTLFSIQTPVSILNYWNDQPSWLPGRIVGLNGFGYQIYVPQLSATIQRQANQIRLRPLDKTGKKKPCQ